MDSETLNKKVVNPDGTISYVSGTNEGVANAISSKSLTPSTLLTPVQPANIPIPPVAGLNSDLTLQPLEGEKRQSDVIKETQELFKQLAGETAFQAEQEDAQGLSEKLKTERDLASRLNALKNEALAIPLQLQQEATGRGITAGGLRPIETEALRKNAIQALSTASLLEAARGNVTMAQQLADRATAQKFEPIKAEIAANLQNLELLAKDPTLTLAQNNRLNAQREAQNARARVVAQQEAEAKEISNVLSTAIKYGLTDPTLMGRIQGASSVLEAQQIAAQYLQDPKAKLELQEARYRIEKLRLEVDAFGRDNAPLPVTGNLVTDVANAISSNKVGATTKTTLSAIMGVQGALEQTAKDNPTGDFKGISPLNTILDARIPFTDAKVLNVPLGLRDALTSKEGITSRAYINGINLKVQQWASGAALTEAQTRQVEQMTPKTTDTDRVVREKVNALYEFMNQQVRSALLSEGIDVPVPQNVDLWEKTDTLEAIFK